MPSTKPKKSKPNPKTKSKPNPKSKTTTKPTAKPKSKPKQSPPPAAQADGIPFPFIGAGEASYFEWAELHVHFTRDVKPAEKARIAKTVPPPIGDVQWEGRHLHASSEQGVGRQIQAAYSKPPKRPTSLTTASKFKIPDGPKLSRFNQDIERWLLEAHAVVPILAAFRRRDWEAGGTELSPWHDESLPHAKRVLKELKPKKDSALEYMVHGIRSELAEAKR